MTGSKKVGHAGTLDPLASGLLIVCTGKHTKKINDFQNLDKVYTGKFVIGATTPSHDLETEIENSKSISGINENEVNQVVSSFMGVNYKDLQNILQSRLMEKEHMNLQGKKKMCLSRKRR